MPNAGPGVPGPAIGSLSLVQRATRIGRCETGGQLALVAASATLGLAALGAVLFLDANEAETTPVLANNARTLDAFCEPAEKLLKAFRITEFNSHALNHHL
jgi:hypothetical protein